MSRFPKLFVCAVVFACTAGGAAVAKYGLGRAAVPEEVKAWDIDVRPDGAGLPEGSGNVADGEALFAEHCAVCHGDFAEGSGNWPVLAGGRDTLKSQDPVKTVGSYWPYLSTVYDYIHRAMPFGNAQSLEPDQIYALTAYILYSNGLVEDDFELSNKNFLDVNMPNAGNFFEDPRPDAQPAKAEPCMENCKDEVKITGKARVIDVTPEDEAEAGKAAKVD